MPTLLRNLRTLIPLAAVVLLLGGCIALRLLQLKGQLGNFDRYIAVDQTDGLTFTFKQPVLLIDDMSFFELAPESTKQEGNAVRWHLRWVKDYLPPGERPSDYEVEADFAFVDGKLVSVHLPERIFSFLQKSFLLNALRSLGHANVDESKRSASAVITSAGPKPLTRSKLLLFLGAPLEVNESEGRSFLHYRYKDVCACPNPGKIDFIFTTDSVTQAVLHLQGKLFHSEIDFDWPGASKSAK